MQLAQPEVTIAFDNDPAQAAMTRGRLLDRVANDKLSVTGMHFNLPSAASVQRDGSGYLLHYDVGSLGV